tara:strand:- start:503 stop:763 length:261 start_codon:yes stop_codon:yes gene_type:complete
VGSNACDFATRYINGVDTPRNDMHSISIESSSNKVVVHYGARTGDCGSGSRTFNRIGEHPRPLPGKAVGAPQKGNIVQRHHIWSFR